MVDELHLLDSDVGPTLEAVVSRMRYISVQVPKRFFNSFLSSNKCLTSSNKKLLVTSASLLGTSALLVVTRSY